jgi:hypothetical protein
MLTNKEIFTTILNVGDDNAIATIHTAIRIFLVFPTVHHLLDFIGKTITINLK